MNTHTLSGTEIYERHRLAKARLAVLGWLSGLVIWAVAVLALVNNEAPGSYLIAPVFLVTGVSIKLALAIKKWRFYERNPHAPPTG